MKCRAGDCQDGGVVFGIVLVVLGSVLLMDKLNVLDASEVLRLWPLALIGIGAHQLIRGAERQNSN